jgi:hypothetical protein
MINGFNDAPLLRVAQCTAPPDLIKEGLHQVP